MGAEGKAGLSSWHMYLKELLYSRFKITKMAMSDTQLEKLLKVVSSSRTEKEVFFPKLESIEKEAYQVWKQAANTVLEVNKWAGDSVDPAKRLRAAQLMFAAFSGEAAAHTRFLKRADYVTGEAVIKALDKLILTTVGEAVALTEFDQLTQGHDDVTTFANRVRNGFMLAYPGKNHEDADEGRMAKRQLLQGLSSESMREHAVLQLKALDKSVTFSAILEGLRLFEVVRQGRQAKRGVHQLQPQEGVVAMGRADPSGRTCHFCHKPGHLCRDCPDLNRAQTFLDNISRNRGQKGRGGRGGQRRGRGAGRGGNAGSHRGRVNALGDGTTDLEDEPLFSQGSNQSGN